MKQLNAIDQLNENIRLQEIEYAKAFKILKTDLQKAGNGMKLSSILKDLTGSGEDNDGEKKQSLLDPAIGLATGFLIKKVLFGSISNPLVKVAATILQTGISAWVTEHPGPVKNAGRSIIDFIAKKINPDTSNSKQDNT
jgi:hypothetical protein